MVPPRQTGAAFAVRSTRLPSALHEGYEGCRHKEHRREGQGDLSIRSSPFVRVLSPLLADLDRTTIALIVASFTEEVGRAISSSRSWRQAIRCTSS
jgi:hypothetical protein